MIRRITEPQEQEAKLIALVPCRSVALRNETMSWDITETLYELVVSEFPSPLAPWGIYLAVLRGSRSEERFTLRIFSPTGIEIDGGFLRVEGWGPNSVADMGFRIANAVASEPGLYVMTVESDAGYLLGGRQISVRHALSNSGFQ